MAHLTVCKPCRGTGKVQQGSGNFARRWQTATCPTCNGEGVASTDAPCAGRQHSDEMVCRLCGLRWDINDDAPPPCNPERLK